MEQGWVYVRGIISNVVYLDFKYHTEPVLPVSDSLGVHQIKCKLENVKISYIYLRVSRGVGSCKCLMCVLPTFFNLSFNLPKLKLRPS